MKCIELVKEENGMITIAGCKIGDNVEVFSDNMHKYCIYCKPNGVNSMLSIIDIDTMSISNPLYNEDILSVEVYCEYNQDKRITWISVHMYYCYSDECDTPSEFKELAKEFAETGRFTVEELYINSSKVYELIGLSNKKCDVNFMWTKKEHSDIVVTLGESIYSEENVYNTELALMKGSKRLALKLGKNVCQLNSSELHEVKCHVDIERLSFYENLWKDKIRASYDAYCDEICKLDRYLSSEQWDIIYKKAGMSERDIALYLEAHEPFEAALDDKSDMYRC